MGIEGFVIPSLLLALRAFFVFRMPCGVRPSLDAQQPAPAAGARSGLRSLARPIIPCLERKF